MIDHVTIRVRDLETTKAFYLQALKPLGYELIMGDNEFIGLGKEGVPDTWFITAKEISGPVHVAWKASAKDEVDEFYSAALAAGAKDNGAPGLRPEYGETYYGAFVIDPDGNNVEAVFW
jgi:catechol 2,3-dioxygenase-like lactoylglutathione lyase family enzyme